MSTEERRRILEMLAQGKISVTDAERLMQAVGDPGPGIGAPPTDASRSPTGEPLKYLHVHVRHQAGDPYVGESWQGRWWARQQAYAGGSRGARHCDARSHAEPFSRDVDVRIPLSLLRSGMKLAAFMPARAVEIISGRLKEQGIDVDLSRLDAAQLEDLFRNLGELTVDLDGGRGQVRITCE
jgi:hypothetical protein